MSRSASYTVITILADGRQVEGSGFESYSAVLTHVADRLRFGTYSSVSSPHKFVIVGTRGGESGGPPCTRVAHLDAGGEPCSQIANMVAVETFREWDGRAGTLAQIKSIPIRGNACGDASLLLALDEFASDPGQTRVDRIEALRYMGAEVMGLDEDVTDSTLDEYMAERGL